MLKDINWRTFFLMALFLAASPLSRGFAAEPILHIESYFPDEVGRTWTYQGSVADEIQRIATYTNTASVKEKAQKNEREVKVFTETNQANQGPAERYFSKDENGIFYHGGDPTTSFEGRLIPYPLVHFPMILQKPFTQLQKKGIPFGRDLDQDGIEELADVTASVTAEAFETVSVPAGLFKNALKIKGIMVIRLTLSGGGEPIELVDKTTNWFVSGLGMVKGIESIEFPAVGSLPPTATVIREQLSDYSEGPQSRQ